MKCFERAGWFFIFVFILFFYKSLPSYGGQEAITIGSVAETPKEEIAKFQPLVDYLAAHLKSQGIGEGKVVVEPSMAAMADQIKEGKVDLYIDSPFPSVRVSQLSGSKPFLERWKKGVETYHSVIFVRKDSGINSLEDLKGKIIAFEEPFSTSGYLLPKAELLKSGLKMTQKKDPSVPVNSDEVGYVFAFDEENIGYWVLQGKLQAGALSTADYQEHAKDRIAELKILKPTIEVPRHVVSYRPGLDPHLVQAIQETLTQMDQDEEGKKVLKNFEKTTKFTVFPESPEKALKPIEDLLTLIQIDLEKTS